METKIIETPFKKFKVEIKLHLTAGDEFEIQKVVYDASDAKGELKEKMGDVMLKMEKKLLETAIISIDGNKEDVPKRLLEMLPPDYNFVKAEIDKMRDYETEKKI